jgi:hypothetical protein
MVVNVWLECEASQSPHQCILALGDNTSAIGWLFTSSKFPAESPAHRAHLMVACQLTSLLLRHDHCLASQHIKGDANVVADLLSFAGSGRDKVHPLAYDNPTDLILTQRFHNHLPDQIPAAFKVSPLPQKGFILGCSCSANAQIVSDGRQESSNESQDRSWRRWLGFCAKAGFASDPFLTALSQQEIDVVAKSFVSCFCTAT